MLCAKSAAMAVVIGVASVSAAGLAAAAPAAAAAHASAAWHIAKTVPGPNLPAFESVAAASGTSAWAFEASGGTAKPRAYQLTGKIWRLRSFPGKSGEQIRAASASSSSNVWAFPSFGSTNRVLHFNGHSWHQVKVFGKTISSGLALSPTDVWVFGDSLGAVHYDGHTWKQSAHGLLGASALSAHSIWAYGPSSVAHWNGSKWSRTSVARLLPKGNLVCGPGFVAGIEALSARDVFAAGAGGCQDGTGPFVLLHYNGRRWSKVAIGKHIKADPVGLIGDGMGGLWIEMDTGAPTSSFMERYANGTLSRVKLPIGEQHLALLGAAIGQRTTAALAFGQSHNPSNPTTSTAVILRYGS